MKARELMIGDWAEYRFTGWTKKDGIYELCQYVKISTIGKLYVRAYNDRVASADGENFYPIPLTPEILEKNGIEPKSKEDTNAFRYLKDGISIVECYANAGGRYRCIIAYGETRLRKTIFFVHELQHALRLCGIDKEITM